MPEFEYFANKIKLPLKDNEIIIKVARPCYATYLLRFFISLLMIILPFFLIYLLLQWKSAGLIIFFVLLALGVIYLCRSIIVAYFNAFIISNLRVIDIDQKGFFDRVVSEASYDKIQDISYRRKGVFATILNYGDVEIQTASTSQKLKMEKIRHPQRLQDLILEVQRNYLDSLGKEEDEALSARELVKLVDKIRKNLTEEEIDQIIKSKKGKSHEK